MDSPFATSSASSMTMNRTANEIDLSKSARSGTRSPPSPRGPCPDWELVIDNLSERRSPRVDWLAPGARLVREETLGLTPARLRGIGRPPARCWCSSMTTMCWKRTICDTPRRCVAHDKPFLGSWSGSASRISTRRRRLDAPLLGEPRPAPG